MTTPPMTDQELIEKCEKTIRQLNIPEYKQRELNELLNRFRTKSGGQGKDGSDEDLAIEVVARFLTTKGRNNRLAEPMKKQFIDGALWMKSRLQHTAQPGPSVEDCIKAVLDAIETADTDTWISSTRIDRIRTALTNILTPKK